MEARWGVEFGMESCSRRYTCATDLNSWQSSLKETLRGLVSSATLLAKVVLGANGIRTVVHLGCFLSSLTLRVSHPLPDPLSLSVKDNRKVFTLLSSSVQPWVLCISAGYKFIWFLLIESSWNQVTHLIQLSRKTKTNKQKSGYWEGRRLVKCCQLGLLFSLNWFD